MLPRTKGPGSPSCLCCWRTEDWTTQRMQNTASHQPASEAAKELGRGAGRNSGFSQQNPDIKPCLASSSTWKVLSKKNPDKNWKDFFITSVNTQIPTKSWESLTKPWVHPDLTEDVKTSQGAHKNIHLFSTSAQYTAVGNSPLKNFAISLSTWISLSAVTLNKTQTLFLLPSLASHLLNAMSDSACHSYKEKVTVGAE